LQTLLTRSERLYRRVARLEAVLRGAEPPTDARAHFARLEQAFGQ
jgi:hypothetical protein